MTSWHCKGKGNWRIDDNMLEGEEMAGERGEEEVNPLGVR